MTENEAIEIINKNLYQGNLILALDIVKSSIIELQQYRVIGTVEEIKDILQIISEGQDDVDESGISTGLLHTLLEYTEYKKIGTVEECREARERQRGKKYAYHSPFTDGTRLLCCPVCHSRIEGHMLYCCRCGQKLNWY